jgi:hypothetical protein
MWDIAGAKRPCPCGHLPIKFYGLFYWVFPRGNERLPKTHVLIQPLLTLDYLNQLLNLTNIYANRNIFLKIFPEIFNKSEKLIIRNNTHNSNFFFWKISTRERKISDIV